MAEREEDYSLEMFLERNRDAASEQQPPSRKVSMMPVDEEKYEILRQAVENERHARADERIARQEYQRLHLEEIRLVHEARKEDARRQMEAITAEQEARKDELESIRHSFQVSTESFREVLHMGLASMERSQVTTRWVIGLAVAVMTLTLAAINVWGSEQPTALYQDPSIYKAPATSNED